MLPDYEGEGAAADLDLSIRTGMGHARNVVVVASADAIIALPGESGTASEVALAGAIGRAVIGLEAWSEVAGVRAAKSVDEAVEMALAAAEGFRSGAR